MQQRFLLFLAALLSSSLLSAQIVSNGLVSHWSFNAGNGNDAVGSNNAALIGTSSSTDRFGNANKAQHLAGNITSYINLGTSNSLKPTSATISIWVNLDSFCVAGGGYNYNPIILTKNQTGNSNFEAYGMYWNSLRQVGVVTTEPPANEKYMFSTATGNFGNWHHLVMSYDNDSLKLYFDGALQNTVAKGFSSVFLAGDSVMVGNSANTANSRYLTGSVDDIRIYNRVLTAVEVDSLRNEANPVVNVPSNGLLAYWGFNSDNLDYSGNGNHLTAVGAMAYGNDRNGNSRSSALLDGSSAFLNTTTPFYDASLNHTVSLWFKTNDSTQTRQTFFNTLPHRSVAWGYNWHGTSGYDLGIGDGNNWNVSTGPNGLDTFTLTNDAVTNWNHVVFTKNGMVWSIYLNNVLVHTFTYSSDPATILNDVWVGAISAYGAGGGSFFNGYLDDFGIWNRVLTATEITALFNGTYTGILSSPANSNNLNVQIFPNPSSGFVQFSADADIEQMELWSVTGQLLQSFRPQSRQGSLQLSLANGMYLLRSYTSTGQLHINKLIIQE